MSCNNSGVRCWLRKAFTNGSLGLSLTVGGRCSNVSVALTTMVIRCFHDQLGAGEVEKGSEDGK